MILLKTTKEVILKPLQSLTNIVERRQSLPILMNVLLNFKSDKLKLTTSDIEIEISTFINIDQIENEQDITVSARKLLDILKNMSENDFIQFSYEKEKLLISQNKTKYSLQILPASEFPIIALPQEPQMVIKQPQKELKKLVESISFSMAYQDVRYYLNGLFVKIDLKKITVVATDGHRLAINSSDIDQKDSEQKEAIEFILPRKAVIEIEKNCGLSDDPLLLHFYQQHLKIEIGSIQIVTKLIDGKYPDYNKVIPEQLQNKIEVNRLELLSGLQKVSILTAEKHRGIKLHVIGDKILLNSSNAEQEEAEEQILCSKSNLDIKMGFNVSYLIEVLSNIKSDSVELLLSDPQSSALILNSNYKNFKYVVMPMRI
jgi:DNA polymerase-3 subunit beta